MEKIISTFCISGHNPADAFTQLKEVWLDQKSFGDNTTELSVGSICLGKEVVMPENILLNKQIHLRKKEVKTLMDKSSLPSLNTADYCVVGQKGYVCFTKEKEVHHKGKYFDYLVYLEGDKHPYATCVLRQDADKIAEETLFNRLDDTRVNIKNHKKEVITTVWLERHCSDRNPRLIAKRHLILPATMFVFRVHTQV